MGFQNNCVDKCPRYLYENDDKCVGSCPNDKLISLDLTKCVDRCSEGKKNSFWEIRKNVFKTVQNSLAKVPLRMNVFLALLSN